MTDNVRIEVAGVDQREAIHDFLLRYFRVDEPISRSVGLSAEDGRQFLLELIDAGLKSPVSFVGLNEKNEVVACRLNELADLSSSDHGHEDHGGKRADSVEKIAKFLDLLMDGLDKLLPPGTKRVMKFIIVSVHPDYQRRGIAKELIERSLQKAAEYQCDFVCTGATATRSQQLFEKKLAFQTLRVINYADYRDPKTDAQIFNCDDGTTCGKLMVKKVGS